MQVGASLNNLRIAPRKVRLVARMIKGMDAMAAKHQLNYIIKKSSKPISKLLDSAMANARNGHGLVRENLFIKDFIVNEGPKLKRFRPKGFGRASPIEKKTSHIKIVLEEKIPGLKSETRSTKSETIPKSETTETIETIKEKKSIKETARPTVKKEIGKKGGIFGGMSGLGRKFFRRKAI